MQPHRHSVELEWKMDQSTYEIVDGASETSLAGNTVGGTGNIMKHVDTGGQYANVQMVTCAKFDLENSHSKFTLKAYIDSGSLTGGSPNQLELKLQDSELGGDAWHNASWYYSTYNSNRYLG